MRRQHSQETFSTIRKNSKTCLSNFDAKRIFSTAEINIIIHNP